MIHVRPTLRLSRTISIQNHVHNLVYHRPSSARPWHIHSQYRTLLTLAIETSCDDTAVAILQKDSPSPTDSITAQTSYGQPKAKARAHLLFNQKVTAPNTGLGGIHPLEALQSHQDNLAKLITHAINFLPDVSPSTGHTQQPPTNQLPENGKARTRTIDYGNGTVKQLPDFISVTRGPGMRSNLHVGLDTAKGLATAWGVPLVGVHHMQAHALTPRLVDILEDDNHAPSASNTDTTTIVEKQSNTDFPFLTLLVSGGHTMLLHSQSLTDHKILATTTDIAIGDALDKSGRIILPESIKLEAKDTAFAKHLSDFAFPDPQSYHLWPVPRRRHEEIEKPKNEYGWQIQAPFSQTRQMAFSFSSIPSIVEVILQRCGEEMDLEEREMLGRTAIGTAFEHLASRTVIALESLQSSRQPVSTLVVSGGVAANSFLRYFLRAMLDVRGFGHVRLVFPPIWLCTDNAAMIAWCGMEMYEAGYRSTLDVEARRKWSMDSGAEDDGILGVGGWVHVDHS